MSQPQFTRTGPIRVHRDARGGAHVIADVTPPNFVGAFPVHLAGRGKVRVGLGSVEGITPQIGGVPLDGSKGSVPALSIDEGPGVLLRSWVCLRVKADLQSGLIDPKNEAAVDIVHVSDLAAVFANGVSPDDGEGRGHFPLAMLVWRSKRELQRIVQNGYFNRRHSFIPATAGRRAFHLFPPAV